MPKGDLLGAFEQWVLLALRRLGDNAYGMTVRREIEERTQRSVSLGAVYTTLDRLERKGYIRSSTSPGTPERGGRARRFFRMQSAGESALDEALCANDAMRDGQGSMWTVDRAGTTGPLADRKLCEE
jgi:DNA-binding PadR family transcriptional regulator